MSLIKGKQLKDNTIPTAKYLNDSVTAAKADTTNGAISTINAGDAAAEGSGTGLSRRDHQHAVSSAAPTTTLDPTTTNAEGSGSSVARNDHTHAVATGLVGDIADIGTVTAAGTVDKYSRADHVHKLGTNSVTGDSISSGAAQEVLESALKAAWVQVTGFSTTAASSDVVTTDVESAASVTTEQNDGTTAEGILSTGTSTGDSAGTAIQNYKVNLVHGADVAESPDKMAIQKGDSIDDGAGNEVYGVLSKTGAVWTLNYYKQDGTAYTFSGVTTVDFMFAEVFNLYTLPPLADLTDISFVDFAGLDTHNHDDRYYTETEVGSATGTTGSDLIGDDDTYTNFNPASTTVKAALEAIDALITSGITPGAHASTHVHNGTDEIDGDVIDITYVPTNYTRTTSPTEVTDVEELTAHLAGIDSEIGSIAGSGTQEQEAVTTEAITGTDTALADTLDSTPVNGASVKLFLNGVFQDQGAGKDYTISGSTITWLASSGTAVDMEADDTLTACYES